jgi:hypothetical protein
VATMDAEYESVSDDDDLVAEQLQEEISGIDTREDPVLPSIEPSELLSVVPSVAVSITPMSDPGEEVMIVPTEPSGSSPGPGFVYNSVLSSVASPSMSDVPSAKKKKKEKKIKKKAKRIPGF